MKNSKCYISIAPQRTRFLWLIAVTSLITFAFLLQVQLTWKPPTFEQHKFWSYNLEKEEPLQPDQTCHLPRVHPFDSSILGYLSPPKGIKCNERHSDLTYIDSRGILRFNETAVDKNGYNVSRLNCYYQEITRKNDFEVNYGEKIRILTNGSRIRSDFIYVSCTDFSSIGSSYSNIHCHVVPKTQRNSNAYRESGNVPYNVLIIGIDSVSRLSFIRYLPETYEFLTKKMNAFVFRGMTKIGDNTFPNLAAILTGKNVFSNELPKVKNPTGTYDEWPCLWKNFSSANYATLFAEDQPKIGLFTYLRGGFRNTPTDHYMTPFWVAVQNSKRQMLSSSLCFGTTPKHLLMLNYTREFVQKYTKSKIPYFSFSFFVELSHDYVRLVSAADKDFKSWLSDLFNSGHLENTFLFFLSDHGHRFDALRATLIGRIEERMPFFSIVVPPSLYKTHPHVISSLQLNVKRLTTVYDVHSSVLDILSHSINGAQLGTHFTFSRGSTLFNNISSKRTCETAGIPDHYCVCEREEKLDVSDSRSVKASTVLLATVNNLVQLLHGNFCSELSIVNIVRSDLMVLPQKVIENSRIYFDKLKTDYRAKGMFYKLRLIIKTSPGDALFEATLLYREDEDSYSVLGDISRINRYGTQSSCIDDATLRKYCYCKNLTNTKT